MRMTYNDLGDRAGLRGYVQFNKYTRIHIYIHAAESGGNAVNRHQIQPECG